MKEAALNMVMRGMGDDVESLGCLNSAGMIIREQLVAVVHVQYL